MSPRCLHLNGHRPCEVGPRPCTSCKLLQGDPDNALSFYYANAQASNEIFRQEEGVRPDSDNHTSSRPHPSTTNEHSSAKKDAPYDLSDPFEPPPLPAHLRKPASYDGAADGAMPTGSPNGQVNGHGTSGVNGNISNGRSCSNEQSASPRRRRSDAANGRKREAELSDEDNTPKRRQVDDTKCRLKKRQTKVAAAYR